jgi:transglutaminase-like putative cysteine protease
MRIRIDHATRYGYAQAARHIIQVLRLTPGGHDGQQVGDWRIETDIDASLRRSEDAFGNIVHTLYTERPTDALTLRVTGDVSTNDTGGVLSGQVERLSPLVFMRDTPLTQADQALNDYARSIRPGRTLDRLHALMAAVRQDVAFALVRGVCQDHAQIFIACARRLGVPARYVSGHLNRSDGRHAQEAAHAWAEAYVEDLGWVGFDPANGVCPTEHYVRVAVGLDALGAAPIRGSSYGGGAEQLSVALDVRPIQTAPQQ